MTLARFVASLQPAWCPGSPLESGGCLIEGGPLVVDDAPPQEIKEESVVVRGARSGKSGFMRPPVQFKIALDMQEE
ncbi:hypothetical protein [Stenotrophomonas sp. LM091]|uniref:hypothetical protein n=1 Tax=Stenotrophomonas sp. LM091 TaxID=1904944 RepID=UPI0012E99A6D|nr:hypothetical protein [Stenotrophomonas sp. LM091]